MKKPYTMHLWIEILKLKYNKMKINYHPETDSLYIDFGAMPATDSEEIRDGIVIDLDINGNITGVDIQHASQKLDLRSFELSSLPVQITKLSA
jgi:uncharacterized protein YuzE